MEHVRATFAALPDPFFRARGADFEAVGERLVRVLLGLPEIRPGAGARKGSIAVCFELTPLDPYQLERAGVIGIVSERGGKTSHAALVARDLGIPYVAGIKNLGAHVPPDATRDRRRLARRASCSIRTTRRSLAINRAWRSDAGAPSR